MKHKYGIIPENPTGTSRYSFPFDNPTTTRGYSHLTFMDTCRSMDRYEKVDFGGIVINPKEAMVVNFEVLRLIAARGGEDLTNEIYVTSAYNSQVRYLEEYFNAPDRCFRCNA